MNEHQFIIEQLTSWLAKYGIPYIALKEGYVPDSDAAREGVVYDEQIFLTIMGTKLGHSSTVVYINQNKLVAVFLENVSNSFLDITKSLGELYGVRYKEMRHLYKDNYLYLF